MKKTMTRFLSLALALCMIFTGSTLVSATDAHTSPDEKIDGTFLFDVLRISHIEWDQVATSNGNRAWNDYFDTTEEDPAYRVWVENTGDHSFTVYVKRGSASSDDIMSGPHTVAPGDQICLDYSTDNKGNKPGRRWVVINPIGGNDFEAHVRVRIAPSTGELG